MLVEKHRSEDLDDVAVHSHIMSLRDVSLGWTNNSHLILRNINLDVNKAVRIAIIGSVGTGKTLLLKGLIGEAHKTSGQLTLAPSTTLAYCSQTAWLENISAEQNMSQYGKEPIGSEFYQQLTIDCVLDDIVRLPTFSSGFIGSGGVTLSGGQRQRLVGLLTSKTLPDQISLLLICMCTKALARALSTGSDVLILDDVFSALDRRTRWQIATTLLRRSPKDTERTIIYTTHDGMVIFNLRGGRTVTMLT